MLHALWYMFVRKLRSPGGVSQTMCHDKKLFPVLYVRNAIMHGGSKSTI